MEAIAIAGRAAKEEERRLPRRSGPALVHRSGRASDVCASVCGGGKDGWMDGRADGRTDGRENDVASVRPPIFKRSARRAVRRRRLLCSPPS